VPSRWRQNTARSEAAKGEKCEKKRKKKRKQKKKKKKKKIKKKSNYTNLEQAALLREPFSLPTAPLRLCHQIGARILPGINRRLRFL
jgi:hypothetical protein